jgi:dihydropteroate synthase-like protein
MNILLVTGTLAENTVKQRAQASNLNSKIFALSLPVAALLSPERIAEDLKTVDLTIVDMILVPGLVRGDTKLISKSTKIPTFKGPRYAADLPTVLENLEKVKLSTTLPADDILQEEFTRKALLELKEAEKNREKLLKKPSSMLIKNVAIGKDFPMRIMAEIVDAAIMPLKEVRKFARIYEKIGASIIDIGMVAGKPKPQLVKQLVQSVKKTVNVPVSIDTLNPTEIKAAVSAGADMVLSIDAGNLDEIADYVSNVPVVVIPTNQREGYFPKKAEDRVAFLEETIKKARKLGLKKILADLVLEPANVSESITAFRLFAMRNPNIPLFVGISNVTELFDADSVGINALLARISSEIGASVLLATEKSNKTRGTVKEEVIAAQMMFLAKKRESVPKDLGIDLLILKNKKNREEQSDDKLITTARLISAEETVSPTDPDPEGSFRILVDREKLALFAIHTKYNDNGTPDVIINGKTADSVYSKIMELGLISRLEHAAYLGNELAKAEIALVTGKDYVQDTPLFKKKSPVHPK